MKGLNVLTLALLCVLLTAAGQIALKQGVSGVPPWGGASPGSILGFFARAATTPTVILGMVLYCASAALWLLVLANADLSFAFPLVSLGFVFTSVYGHFALHEPMNAARLTGTALIVAGVVFVARS